MKHVLTALFALCLIFPAHAATENNDPARSLIEQAATQMTSRLIRDQSLVQRHDYYLEQLVHEIILPVVDAPYMARRVLGKFWKRASTAQQQSFLESFQEKVIRTYAGAFRAYDGEAILFFPARYNDDATKAIVQSQISRNDGSQPVSVDYRLYLNSNQWKVYDVVIEGISLIRSFRDQVGHTIDEMGLAQAISRLADEYHSEAPVVRLGAHSWTPYSGKTLPEQGLVADIVRSAYARTGYRAEFVFGSTSMLQQMISKGGIAGDIAAWQGQSTPVELLYSEPYLTNQLVLVKRPDDPLDFTDQDSLAAFVHNKGYRLGVYDDVDFGDIAAWLDSLFVVSERDYCSQMFRDVAAKALDTALVDRWAGQVELDSKPAIASHLVMLETPLVTRDLHVTIARVQAGDPDYAPELLIEAFNTGLRLIREDGTYQSLLKKHNYPE
ncbi:MAG: ABC transporter substrate-binding protein [Pseudomonadota bacterium]|nr:ABC transporter substrate-binding protein [Pseudomonadota bacterium]